MDKWTPHQNHLSKRLNIGKSSSSLWLQSIHIMRKVQKKLLDTTSDEWQKRNKTRFLLGLILMITWASDIPEICFGPAKSSLWWKMNENEAQLKPQTRNIFKLGGCCRQTRIWPTHSRRLFHMFCNLNLFETARPVANTFLSKGCLCLGHFHHDTLQTIAKTQRRDLFGSPYQL
jgi:hypothetical protein